MRMVKFRTRLTFQLREAIECREKNGETTWREDRKKSKTGKQQESPLKFLQGEETQVPTR